MKKLRKKLLKNKPLFYISCISFLFVVISSVYFIYSLSLLNGVEDFLRLVARILFAIFTILFLIGFLRLLVKEKKGKLVFLIILSIFYSGAVYFAANNVDKIMSKLSKISTNVTTQSSSLVTLKSNTVNSINEIGEDKIGILSDEKSESGNIIPKQVIQSKKLKNEIVEYDDFVTMIKDLLDEKINYIFLPTNYSILFSNINGLEHLQEETKIIFTESKETKQETSGGKKLDKPFTVLLMGVDSELEEIKGSSFNGDSLMLITFNPSTLNTTVLSIPRDSYVPIACFTSQRKNKITHAAWYGEECMMNTIQNFLDVPIDYYVKVNFKGVVKLVDAVGGIEIDVPYSFCEQNSNREFGENTIYVREGLQTLDGEQALAYARNRHPNPEYCSREWTNYVSNDFIRGQHQQEVMRALLNKMKEVRSLDTFYHLLDVISISMETNISTNELLSLYNVGKDILAKSGDTPLEELLGFQRLYLSGYDAYIFDYHPQTGQGMRMDLYDFVPYKGSILDVSNAMKRNLGLLEQEVQKTFSFDIENKYEETVIGQKSYAESRIPLLQNLIGSSVAYARSYAENNGIYLTVQGSEDGTIVDQSIPDGTDLEYVTSLTVTTSSSIDVEEEEEEETLNCSLEKNKENTSCAMPTFLGETKSFVESWFRRQGYDIHVVYTEKPSTDDGWDSSLSGTVYSQSTTNAYLYDYIGTGKTFEIIYWEEKEEEVTGEETEENSNETENP